MNAHSLQNTSFSLWCFKGNIAYDMMSEKMKFWHFHIRLFMRWRWWRGTCKTQGQTHRSSCVCLGPTVAQRRCCYRRTRTGDQNWTSSETISMKRQFPWIKDDKLCYGCAVQQVWAWSGRHFQHGGRRHCPTEEDEASYRRLRQSTWLVRGQGQLTWTNLLRRQTDICVQEMFTCYKVSRITAKGKP